MNQSALSTIFLYKQKEVTVLVNKPKKIRENFFSCRYTVLGLDHSFDEISIGADSLQALYYALSKIDFLLAKYTLDEHPDYGQAMPLAPFWLETEFLPNDINWEVACLEKKLDINTNIWDPRSSKSYEIIDSDSELVSREMVYNNKYSKIIIAKPSFIKDENLYVCPFQFEGMPMPNFNKSYGGTSFQAFMLTYQVLWYALLLIRDNIYTSISPNRSLGFPMIAEVKEDETNIWLKKRNNILKRYLKIR